MTDKILCWLIGWNYNLLKECSQASRNSLRRYSGAVILLMVLWGFIGFCMAERYFGLKLYGSLTVAVVFSCVILLIERQIILMVGKNNLATRFRIVLALCMALIGATVIDQYIFRKDIDAGMAEVIEQRTDEQLQYRTHIIEDNIAAYRIELDSLNIEASRLSDEINAKPMVKETLYNRHATGLVDSLGKPVMASGYTQENIPNPKIKDRERVYERIGVLQNELSVAANEKQRLRDNVRQEIIENVGLLTELEITLSKKVLFSGWSSIVFYSLVFIFFLSLEILVVSGKFGNKGKCDYEVLIEKQQDEKIRNICAILKSEDVTA